MIATTNGLIAGRSLEEWNSAFVMVEAYFEALLVRNRLLRGQLVTRVLDRAMQRAATETERPTSELAAEEMDHLVTDWFAQVLNQPVQPGDVLLSTRGRLALLLADMPSRWQDQFLEPDPWPAEFVQAMRQGFLRARPDIQFPPMSPRPIDLGTIITLTKLGSLPYVRLLLTWLGFALLLVVLFRMTH